MIMRDDDLNWQSRNGAINRRAFLERTAVVGIGAALTGSAAGSRAFAQTPSQGGTLIQGIQGGAPGDSFDPTTWTNSANFNLGWQVFNNLVEIDAHKKAKPELAEKWEARPGAAEWVFDLVKSVQFHNGKTLDADDVIYSLELHRGPDTKSGGKSLLNGVKEIRKTGPHQITISLNAADADFPVNLADYHFVVVPNGFTDWAKPIGTGGYTLETFEPGVRCVTKRFPGYWKPGCAHFDAVETTTINDTNARISALLSGAVHVIDQMDPVLAGKLDGNPNFVIQRSPSGFHFILAMDCTSDAFKNNDVRLAMKYAINRKQILKSTLNGYGSIGNDHPIPPSDPFFNTELPQRPYDPEKAKFHLKKAGLTNFAAELYTSVAAFPQANDVAALYQESAKAAGIELAIKVQPVDGYWDNIWMKRPLVTTQYNGRATADSTFSLVYKSDAAWNDARWNSPKFDKLLLAGRAELDFAKRKAMYWEMQRLASEDGGWIVPVFADFVDAADKKVKGFVPSPVFGLAGQRLAEQAWFES